jgi:hypothetical protein
MHRLFVGAAIAAALVATPALAQSYKASQGSGNIVMRNPVQNEYGQVGATGEFAYGPSRQPMRDQPLAARAQASAHHSRHRHTW